MGRLTGMVRLIIHLNGTVQGVGFRPFVYRTAKKLGLKGFVANDSTGVLIEVEGGKESVDNFLLRLNRDKPPLSSIYHQELRFDDPAGYRAFEIRASTVSGQKDAVLLPDIATCDECIQELGDAGDRRYMYPFINCTDCGPRFTIIESLPYDRPNTTMKIFSMCPECLREYKDPSDRRFHAQPNACPLCGPAVMLLDKRGSMVAKGQEAISLLLRKLSTGCIAAVKGIGGYHLVCDATSDHAVVLLRERKRRTEKPFAVMFRDLFQLKIYAEPTVLEEALLSSPSRPVVLVRKRGDALESVSPGLGTLGAFLPYSPIHHILLNGLDSPIVATSGNLSEEPIVKGDDEALERLSPLSDFMLVHNRPIHRRCDDSVTKIVGGYPQVIRRSRGYVPLPVLLPFRLRRKVLAVGGHKKNTFAIGFDDRIIISQHIGDMETPESMDFFVEAIDDLSSIYGFEPEIVVHDLHPGYETSRWAATRSGVEIIPVQHHYAHILSCMAENGLTDMVLGVAWDGTGYGEDGTIWGGEFLVCDLSNYERVYHFRPLRLIGGEKAVREPRRIGLSILFELFDEEAMGMDFPSVGSFGKSEIEPLFMAWKKGINSPLTSSVGRLIDGLASLSGISQICNYEAQAAMMVEELFDYNIKDHYSYRIGEHGIDWLPMFHDLLQDADKDGAPTRFINTLVKIVLDLADMAGMEKICLSGGVFQNDPLSGLIIEGLKRKGCRVYINRQVPANDGGISLGQAVYGGMLKV
jgi:hydrogenase maturation protein HypF